MRYKRMMAIMRQDGHFGNRRQGAKRRTWRERNAAGIALTAFAMSPAPSPSRALHGRSRPLRPRSEPHVDRLPDLAYRLGKASRHVSRGKWLVFTNHDERDEHLRKPDFLWAEKYPEITFRGISAEQTGPRTGKITGELTMRRDQASDARRRLEQERPGSVRRHDATGISARTKIRRSDFSMTYAVDSGLVGDEVEIILEFEAIRQAQTRGGQKLPSPPAGALPLGTPERVRGAAPRVPLLTHLWTGYGVARSLAIYYGRPWRFPVMDAFYVRLVRPGDLCFDLGAHVGNRVRSWRKLGARVVAVEPQPTLVRVLRLLYSRDPEVHVVAAAVAEREGVLPLHLNLANPTISTSSEAFIERAVAAPSFRVKMAAANYRSRDHDRRADPRARRATVH